MLDASFEREGGILINLPFPRHDLTDTTGAIVETITR